MGIIPEEPDSDPETSPEISIVDDVVTLSEVLLPDSSTSSVSILEDTTIEGDSIRFVRVGLDVFSPKIGEVCVVETGFSATPGREWTTPSCVVNVSSNHELEIPILNLRPLPLLLKRTEKIRIKDTLVEDPSAESTDQFVAVAGELIERESVDVEQAREMLRNANIGAQLNGDERETLIDLLANEPMIFMEIIGRIGRTDLAVHQINTGAALPFRGHRLGRVSRTEREIIQTHVEDMVESGVIVPSQIPWASSIVLVKKGDGKIRFCIDYRR